jgi:hypothetical protein
VNANNVTAEVKIRAWLSVDDVAKKLSISPESVYRRAIPWQADPIPHIIRWKILKLDEDTEEGRRFLGEDIEAMLFDPPKMEQPGRRKLFVRK